MTTVLEIEISGVFGTGAHRGRNLRAIVGPRAERLVLGKVSEQFSEMITFIEFHCIEKPAVSPTKPTLSGEWPSASFQANQPSTSSDSSTVIDNFCTIKSVMY